MKLADRIPGLAELWIRTKGDPQVRIAIIDGNIDSSHTSLSNAILVQTEPSEQGRETGPAVRHGTQVTSIIFGKHGSSIEGIAPNCTGIIIPIFRDCSGELLPSSETDLARAIGVALQHGANVINISGGKPSQSGQPHPLLLNTLRMAVNSGVLIVAAAGNDGCFCQHIPSSSEMVLTVGAMNEGGDPLPFSNWGSTYQESGILALGKNISVAEPDGETSLESGTSFATAIVSGVAGLLMSLQIKLGGTPNAEIIRQRLFSTADGCDTKPVSDCRKIMVGRINLSAATHSISTTSASVIKGITLDDTPKNIEIIEPNNKGKHEMTIQHDNQQQETTLVNSSSAAMETDNAQLQGIKPLINTVPIEGDNEGSMSSKNSTNSLQPSACGCGGGQPLQQVYTLGTLKIDFQRTRRESIQVQLPVEGSYQTPLTEEVFLEYLDGKYNAGRKKPWEAQAAEWVLVYNEAPLYAIHPSGAFGSYGYDALREFLTDQIHSQKNNERAVVAIAGYLGGQAVLSNGNTVTILIPEIDGMSNWTNSSLIESIDCKEDEKICKGLDNYLIKQWRLAENHGISPQHRAINFAAHNLTSLVNSQTDLFNEGYIFDAAVVERSETCSPDSECYKVLSYFFKDTNTAWRVIEYTVDVSGVFPVKISDEVEYPTRIEPDRIRY
jgi:cyanobactin maturation PatA/PatG family protease